MIDSLTSGLATTDLEGRMLTFNRAAEVITGLPALSVIGRRIEDVLDLPPSIAADLNVFGSGRGRRVETSFRTGDGRQIERVLILVGRSFRATTWQMVSKIYLPAMRDPVVNGVRLGLGVAIIGTLLAETKLSNRGMGYLIIQAYSTFDMPKMYALLIVLFVLAIGANALIGRLSGTDMR